MWHKEVRFDLESEIQKREFGGLGYGHAVTVTVTLSITNGINRPTSTTFIYKGEHPDVTEAARIAFQRILDKQIYNRIHEVHESPCPQYSITDNRIKIDHLPDRIQELIVSIFGTNPNVYDDLLPPRMLTA